MLKYIVRRFIYMIPTLVGISIVSFITIQLPPGDFLTYYIAGLEARGEVVDPAEVAALKARYKLDAPLHRQYLSWFSNVLQGRLGRSLLFDKRVSEIILSRLPASVMITLLSFVFIYLVSIPIGIFSATHQYSIPDYIFTVIGFLGLAIPNFFLALILLYTVFTINGNVLVGLFSFQYRTAPMSWGKFIDLLRHLWIPMVVIGTAGTCGAIRSLRANMLDEYKKPYVVVARAKGVPPRKLLYKYPFRIAINPIMSTIGWMLPALVSGEMLVSIVLNIPTLSPVFLVAIRSQDMYLAGSIVMVLSTLTVIGTLISDILLAWVDPRIRGSV